MSTRPCAVDGCERSYVARGYCATHYRRWKKYGDPGDPAIRTWMRGRTCSVDQCEREHGGQGYCDAHLRREQRHGQPGSSDFQPVRGPRRALVTYQSAHRRVEDARGRASQHTCQACGGPAKEWAYNHRDEDEIFCPLGRPYSLDAAHYVPMCASCHRRFDLAYTRRAEVSS